MTLTIETLPHSLDDWGWDEAWASAFRSHATDGLVPARVVAQHRGRWQLVDETGELSGGPTGRFRHDAGEDGLPVVGDWVGTIATAHRGEARIDALLPRRAAFRRRAAGPRLDVQVIAANIDVLFVASSLNGDLNPRRLERYVVMARESGATPVVLLTKSDLAADGDAWAATIARDLSVAAVALSAATGDGIRALSEWLVPGRTVALVGSSGVGKSTLLNRLAGTQLMATREIREDDARGRHTTTHRELFRLGNGVLVLDTPGMREMGLWDADEGLDDTFADIVDLAGRCRFSDCSHEREPGCAVSAALHAGELDPRRLRGYRRLEKELAQQPSPAKRREASRRFSKQVGRAAAESIARKSFRWRDG